MQQAESSKISLSQRGGRRRGGAINQAPAAVPTPETF